MSSFEDYFHKNIAKQIRKYRTIKGLTQEQLSELLNKNTKYIGHVERCERKISNKILVRLMDLLKIQPAEFYSFEENYKWTSI